MDEQRETGADPNYASRTEDGPEVEGHVQLDSQRVSAHDDGHEPDVEGHAMLDISSDKFDKFDKF